MDQVFHQDQIVPLPHSLACFECPKVRCNLKLCLNSFNRNFRFDFPVNR